jgi:hypothetical protein
MPIYNLQYGSSHTPCGQLQITGSSGAAAQFQWRANANAAWASIATTTPSVTGTPDTPQNGDTLSMGTGTLNGQTFDGTATYTTSKSPAGYYAGAAASIKAGVADWDAADGSGTV